MVQYSTGTTVQHPSRLRAEVTSVCTPVQTGVWALRIIHIWILTFSTFRTNIIWVSRGGYPYTVRGGASMCTRYSQNNYVSCCVLPYPCIGRSDAEYNGHRRSSSSRREIPSPAINKASFWISVFTSYFTALNESTGYGLTLSNERV